MIGFGGFGNMNAYPARLVLESVSDVTPKEIDYSKTDAATKGDALTRAGRRIWIRVIDAAQKTIGRVAGRPGQGPGGKGR